MCGRYTITVTMDELMVRFLFGGHGSKYGPRYNIAPGQWIPAIIGGTASGDPEQAALNRFGELRWGLVPHWSQEENSGGKPINLRIETAAQKPGFRKILERKRCLVPADGFYEWKTAGTKKQPVRFVMKDRSLFGMAALYDSWVMEDGSKLHSCAILTTEPNTIVAEVHSRMPVILRQEDESKWLDRGVTNAELLLSLCRPYNPEEMTSYEVDPRVGNVRNDDPECLEPLRTLL
jgi:putative SOS response-associated peptidase YedK